MSQIFKNQRAAYAHMRQNPQTLTAHILGTGPTLAAYNPKRTGTTYGVNNIFMFHPVMHLITLDNPYEWPAQTNWQPEHQAKLNATLASTPKFWHHPKTTGDARLMQHPAFTHTPVQYYVGNSLFAPKCPHWLDSTFVATALAARHGHSRIIIYGADYYNHPHLQEKIQAILTGYHKLKTECRSHGIQLYTAHRDSALSAILPVYP